MFCLGCHYQLNGLAENRCPECGREFDPKDQSTFNSSASASRRWLQRLGKGHRAVMVVGFFGLWYLSTMANATANTSWEHHPHAGPFIIIKESLVESHRPGDWAFALLFWAFFCAFPVHWIIAGKMWSAIVTLILSAGMLMVSFLAASVAAC